MDGRHGEMIETAHIKSHGQGEVIVMPGDAGIPIELSEKILAYVEREAGRDALLSPEDEAEVRTMLARDPAARARADDFRDVDTGLKAVFQAFGNMPVSEELMQRIHAQTEAFEARENNAVAGKVVRPKL